MIKDSTQSTGWFTKYAMALTVFSLVCLISAWFFNRNSGESQNYTFKDFLKEEGQVQEIQTQKRHQVFELVASYPAHNLTIDRDWVSANLEIQSPTGTRLFGYSFNFFQEWRTNQDGDNYRHSENRESVKITLPYKGTYKIKVNGKTNATDANQSLSVNLKPKQASALPFFWAGVITLVLGVASAWVASKF